MSEISYLDIRVRIDPRKPEVALLDLQKRLEEIFGRFLNASSATKSANGCQSFLSGVKLQWGTSGRTGAGNITITYPESFSSAAYVVSASFRDCASGFDGTQALNVPISTRTTSGCVIQAVSTSALGALTIDWWAIGY